MNTKLILTGVSLGAMLTLTACGSEEVDLKTADIDMTIEDAVNNFNNTHADAQLTNVGLDYDNGKYIFSVDGFDDTNEYEMDFDAETKEVLNDKSEKLDSEDKYEVETDVITIDNNIQPMDAMEAAVAERNGTVESYEVDSDFGQIVYDVTVKDGNTEAEVRINAVDGSVVGVENEE